MVGKLFIFVLISVSVAQDTGLEDAIQRGLLRAKNINDGGERRIQAAVREVGYKVQLIQAKAEDFVRKSVRTQDGMRQSLRNIALAMEEKAKANNAPESAFECIKKAEDNANKQIETFTGKFQTDVRRTESTKLANIRTDTKPLEGMPKALEVRYQRAVQLIKDCQSESCVNSGVNSFGTWLDMLGADMSRILGQVSTIYNNFMRDASTFLRNTNMQVSRINNAASGSIKRCVSPTEC